MFNIAQALSPAVERDPHFDKVRLLMQGSGTPTGTELRGGDASKYGVAVSRSGTPTVSASVKKFGKSSITAGTGTGSSNVFIISSPQLPAIGTGDFTIEMWIYKTAANDISMQLMGSDTGIRFFVSSSVASGGFPGTTGIGRVAFYAGASGATQIPVGLSAITPNTTWTHLALVRSSSVVYAFYNGNLLGSAADTTDYPAQQFRILNGVGSTAGQNSRNFAGYVDDVRFTFGLARYTEAFTPPTRQFLNA
jgi:hypothetical protein